MSESLTFYTNPQSRGRIVRWMLEETGVAYDTQVIEYGPAMKSAEYLAINPMGKVPAIKHGDTVVTETAAICAYLADAFPEAGLGPPLNQRGSYYRWFFFAAGPLEAALANKSFGFELKAEQQGVAGYGSLELVLDTLEDALQASPYITGDQFTAVDLFLGSHIGWGMQFGSLEKRPAFEVYSARCSDREAFIRASEMDDKLVPES